MSITPATLFSSELRVSASIPADVESRYCPVVSQLVSEQPHYNAVVMGRGCIWLFQFIVLVDPNSLLNELCYKRLHGVPQINPPKPSKQTRKYSPKKRFSMKETLGRAV